jgi:carbamoyl-phosphate synthase small subunit
MRAFLGLATGDIFPGELIVAGDLVPGEVILYHADKFSYQLLTDPVSYGRIIVSDTPTITNRWPTAAEIESYSPHLRALVITGQISGAAERDDHYGLANYFRTNGITLFKPHDSEGLLTLLIQVGPVAGLITPARDEINKLFVSPHADRPAIFPEDCSYTAEPDPVRRLSTRLEFFWDLPDQNPEEYITRKYQLVAYDFGLPYSTLRNLKRLGCDIRIVPADYSPEDVIALKPEGILLAGGPGHPRDMGYAISNITRLIGLRPILASGLGHLLLGLAIGAKIEIMKKPHFGNDIIISTSNRQETGNRLQQVATTQHHLVSIDKGSLQREGFKITYTNAGDGTVEGFAHDDYLIHSYAFALGGGDEFTLSCLRDFLKVMEAHRAAKGINKQ